MIFEKRWWCIHLVYGNAPTTDRERESEFSSKWYLTSAWKQQNLYLAKYERFHSGVWFNCEPIRFAADFHIPNKKKKRNIHTLKSTFGLAHTHAYMCQQMRQLSEMCLFNNNDVAVVMNSMTTQKQFIDRVYLSWDWISKIASHCLEISILAQEKKKKANQTIAMSQVSKLQNWNICIHIRNLFAAVFILTWRIFLLNSTKCWVIVCEFVKC